MWDENDGFCLYSYESYLVVDGHLNLTLSGARGEGTPFSAACRRYTDDPDLPFRTMREFLQGTHGVK
eukprot:44041-Eustigmatos_ZCMA.PRE.1